MAKLLVYMDDDAHEDLKELAHRHKTTMAALVRYAIDKTFEDQLDVIAGEKGLEEYLRGLGDAPWPPHYRKQAGEPQGSSVNSHDATPNECWKHCKNSETTRIRGEVESSEGLACPCGATVSATTASSTP